MESKSKRGFTLIEVLMSVSIMSIMTGVMILNYHAADQTPKREAEKVAAYIVRLTNKSDRIKIGFEMIISGDSLCVSWGNNSIKEPSFDISAGLTYNHSFDEGKLKYNYETYPRGAKISVSDNKEENKSYIEIKSAANLSSPCYVRIDK